MYLGDRPGVSTFVAEFLKRKAADPEKLRRQKSGKGLSRSGSDSGSAKGAWVSAATGAGAGAASAAGAGGKKKKGKKVDASLLGFASKTDFSLLAGQQE
jgi:hypothetical protein